MLVKTKAFLFSKAILILDPILKHEYSAAVLELDPCFSFDCHKNIWIASLEFYGIILYLSSECLWLNCVAVMVALLSFNHCKIKIKKK